MAALSPVEGLNQSSEDPLQVNLKIYDILGREIKTLVNKLQKAGEYSITFNAGNLPSGIYIFKLNAGSFIQNKKMLFVR